MRFLICSVENDSKARLLDLDERLKVCVCQIQWPTILLRTPSQAAGMKEHRHRQTTSLKITPNQASHPSAKTLHSQELCKPLSASPIPHTRPHCHTHCADHTACPRDTFPSGEATVLWGDCTLPSLLRGELGGRSRTGLGLTMCNVGCTGSRLRSTPAHNTTPISVLAARKTCPV